MASPKLSSYYEEDRVGDDRSLTTMSVMNSDAGLSSNPPFNKCRGCEPLPPTPVMESDIGQSSSKGKLIIRLVLKKKDEGSGTAVKEMAESDSHQARAPKRRKRESKEGGMGGGTKKDKGSSKNDVEMEEMWATVVGREDDEAGFRTMDNSGVDPSDRFSSDNEAGSAADFPQGDESKEDQEFKQLMKLGQKKKKIERTAADIAFIVEKYIAELEVAAEEDAELNKQSKPAINKLKKLPLLTEVLSKKQLQHEFLDHGVLNLLKSWLEPLPDGSLPNINIRTAVLKILTDFPIDLEEYNRKEQLKMSGLGKVITFLSRSNEETKSNRKLAKHLVDKWSRSIFNKSMRFEDMRSIDYKRIRYRNPLSERPITKATGLKLRDDDHDFSQKPKSAEVSNTCQISQPEPLPLVFVVRPQSKINPEEVKGRAKLAQHDRHQINVNKKLQKLKAQKKRNHHAIRVSVDGRSISLL